MNDRNPDVLIGRDEIPPGCHLIEGKNLQRYARLAKVPFGIGYRVSPGNKKGGSKPITLGLIIRDVDRARFLERLNMPRRVQPGH